MIQHEGESSSAENDSNLELNLNNLNISQTRNSSVDIITTDTTNNIVSSISNEEPDRERDENDTSNLIGSAFGRSTDTESTSTTMHNSFSPTSSQSRPSYRNYSSMSWVQHRNQGVSSISGTSRLSASANDLHRTSYDRSYNDYTNDITSNLNYSTPGSAMTSTTRSRITPIGWNSVETKAGIAPCQRSLHTASIWNGSLYIFGGYDGQSRINDFHCYSFSDKTWAPVQAMNPEHAPSPRDRHVSVVYQNCLYIFGGFDGTSRVNDFFQFDFHTMKWTEISYENTHTQPPPTPRHSHSAVVYRDCLYVFGGYDGSYRSDFHKFNFRTEVWSIVPPATLNTADGVVLAVGGGATSVGAMAPNHGRPLPQQQSHHHIHHHRIQQQQQQTNYAPRARYRGTCVVHEKSHCMILFGGHDGSRHLSDTHMFDFEKNAWMNIQAEGNHPIPRDSHVSVMFQDSMYVFGGSTGSAMNDLHELRLEMDENTKTLVRAKWAQVVGSTGLSAPGHRFCHVAAVYGSSIYIFGGYDGLNRLNDFISFNFGVDDLTCNIMPSTLISDLQSFVDNEFLSDITIIIEDQPVYAHKLMLTRCPYFHAMFMGEMMESSQNTIRLEEVRHPIFLLILEYLYTDHVTVLLEDAMELFVAADKFCIPRLKSICEKTMLESITIDTAANLFYLADFHSALCLKTKSLKFILTHFENVSKTPTFEEMARSNVELVFEILRNR